MTSHVTLSVAHVKKNEKIAGKAFPNTTNTKHVLTINSEPLALQPWLMTNKLHIDKRLAKSCDTKKRINNE